MGSLEKSGSDKIHSLFILEVGLQKCLPSVTAYHSDVTSNIARSNTWMCVFRACSLEGKTRLHSRDSIRAQSDWFGLWLEACCP